MTPASKRLRLESGRNALYRQPEIVAYRDLDEEDAAEGGPASDGAAAGAHEGHQRKHRRASTWATPVRTSVRGADTSDAKLAIVEECGFTITRNPSEMARLLKGLL